MNEDRTIRAGLDRHWAASDANDFEAEHEIYRDDAVLDCPQSGERICGRRNIQASRFAQPNKKRFTVRRILGAADLWVTEFVLTYDVAILNGDIMEFRDGKATREPQHFGDPFEPGALASSMGRTQYVEMFAMKLKPPSRWLPRIRLPRSGHEMDHERFTVRWCRMDRPRAHPEPDRGWGILYAIGISQAIQRRAPSFIH